MGRPVPLAVLGCLVLAFAVEGAGRNKAPDAEALPAVGPKGEKLTVAELIDRLGARSYRTRQAAQNVLARMDADILPALVRAQKNRTDPEVLRRLERLVPLAEARAMLKPKRVTLHLDRKPLNQILEEITRQTGYVVTNNGGINNELYSIHLDNVPFWQALDKVCREAKLYVYPYMYNNEVIQLYAGGTSAARFVRYEGTFRLAASGFHYQRSVNFAGAFGPAAQPVQRSESLTFNFVIQTEPKLPFLQVNTPVVTEAYDERNRPMAPPVPASGTHFYSGPTYSKYGSGSRSYFGSLSANLVRPSRDSKVAKLIRGEVPVLLLSKQSPEVTIDKVLEVKNKKFRGGKTEIAIDQVTAMNNWGNGQTYQVKLSVKEEGNFQNNDWTWQNSLQQRLELYDAKGMKYQVWSNSLFNRGGRFAEGTLLFQPPPNVAVGPPARLVYHRWHPREHRIKFEFRDLPLP